MLIIAFFVVFWMVLCVITLKRPAFALGASFCLHAFKQWGQATSPFIAANQTLPNYAIALLLLIGAIVACARRPSMFFPRNLPKAWYLALSLYVLALISYLWTISPEGYAQEWLWWYPYILMWVVIGPLLITTPASLQDAFYGTMIAGSIALFLVFLHPEWQGRGLVIYGMAGRYQGNPLAISALAGYVSIIVLLMNFVGVARIWQILRWLIVALCLAIIIKSGSRGQFLANVLAIIVALPLSRRMKNLGGFFFNYDWSFIICCNRFLDV